MPTMHPFDTPALRGGLLALLAAALFGISTPLVQRLGAGMGAFGTAALLYAGAAAAGVLSLRSTAQEARLRRADIPRLLAMAGLGAALGPVALASLPVSGSITVTRCIWPKTLVSTSSSPCLS